MGFGTDLIENTVFQSTPPVAGGAMQGMRYKIFPVLEDRLGVKKKDGADSLGVAQVIEHEALRIWADQRGCLDKGNI